MEEIYNEAMELRPEQRDNYLAETCAGDESLRKEVEALLHSASEGGDFLKEAVLEFAAKALAEDCSAQVSSLSGETKGHSNETI